MYNVQIPVNINFINHLNHTTAMIAVENLVLDPGAYYKIFMQPGLADITPDFNGVYTGMFNDFTVFPKVSLARGQALVDVFTNTSILQRKDRSCKLNWTTLGTSDARRLTVAELYGATAQCFEQFYDGDFKDFRDSAPQFLSFIVNRFKKLIWKDLATNSYFGDITRIGDNVNDNILGEISWNKYDGVVAKINKYANSGILPASQMGPGGALPSGPMDPTTAYDCLKAMFDAQNDLMTGIEDLDLAFYIDYRWAHAYMRYLVAAGTQTVNAVNYIQNGIPVLDFEGVPIFVNRLWNPVLRKLNKVGGSPTEAHMGILTIRKNLVFGTDNTYGGGPLLNQAFEVYYDWHDRQWKVVMDMVAGTEIIAPQHIVFNITNMGTYS
jgi:hypothetical protein